MKTVKSEIDLKRKMILKKRSFKKKIVKRKFLKEQIVLRSELI